MINQDYIENIYNTLKNYKIEGKNADYIPELSKVDEKLYSISIYTIDGKTYNFGDYNNKFAIESCSKVFTLSLALEKYGVSYLKKMIGEKKSKDSFNSICSADRIKNHTINSFDNGGAIATTSLLYQPDKEKFTNLIIDNMSDFACQSLSVSNKIYNSEINNSNHNLAIAHLLKSYNKFYGDIDDSIDVYTKQCSVMVSTQEVALMAATLANNGINPKSKKRLVKPENVKYILKHMALNGIYNDNYSWLKKSGVYVKSGVGGIILLVIPGVMGIGIASPPLNKYGNSVKGIQTAKKISLIYTKHKSTKNRKNIKNIKNKKEKKNVTKRNHNKSQKSK
jgi:glutaminase